MNTVKDTCVFEACSETLSLQKERTEIIFLTLVLESIQICKTCFCSLLCKEVRRSCHSDFVYNHSILKMEDFASWGGQMHYKRWLLGERGHCTELQNFTKKSLGNSIESFQLYSKCFPWLQLSVIWCSCQTQLCYKLLSSKRKQCLISYPNGHTCNDMLLHHLIKVSPNRHHLLHRLKIMTFKYTSLADT